MTVDIKKMLGAVYDIKSLHNAFRETEAELLKKQDGTTCSDRIVEAGLESLAEWYFDELLELVGALCATLGDAAPKPVVQSYEEGSPTRRKLH